MWGSGSFVREQISYRTTTSTVLYRFSPNFARGSIMWSAQCLLFLRQRSWIDPSSVEHNSTRSGRRFLMREISWQSVASWQTDSHQTPSCIDNIAHGVHWRRALGAEFQKSVRKRSQHQHPRVLHVVESAMKTCFLRCGTQGRLSRSFQHHVLCGKVVFKYYISPIGTISPLMVYALVTYWLLGLEENKLLQSISH